MAVDPAVIGRRLEPTSLTIDAGRLRFFAKAIGETDPLFTDEAHARGAGHRALPLPPTFLFAIELEAPEPFAWLDELGVELTRILHGEQRFTYHRMAYAGDTLTATPTITDVYSKKNGVLEFIEKTTTVLRGDSEPVADLRTVIVVRNI